MRSVRVSPCAAISGELTVPGDKSISHRAAIISALASGTSSITGFLESEDCLNTLKIVGQLGAKISRNGSSVHIEGCAGKLHRPESDLDCGNSGTGMRLLAGVLAGQRFESRLIGDATLSSRPMKRISQPLELMGAKIALTGKKGTAPVTVHGGALKAIRYELPVASAQVKSCVLLAGLFAKGDTVVVEPEETRNHTELMLIDAGADLSVKGLTISLREGSAQKLVSRDWAVPGDFSSAAFWIVCAAALKGSKLVIHNVGLNPRRTALLSVLARMGADIHVRTKDTGASEPVGDITVRGANLKAAEIGGAEIPNLVDEVPILAVAAALAEGRTVVRDARELRVKESDRLSAISACLGEAGVDIEETEDGLIVNGTGTIEGGCTAGSMGDHRIAMAMAVAGLCAKDTIEVHDVDCILTSYPSFWDDLNKVAEGCCV